MLTNPEITDIDELLHTTADVVDPLARLADAKLGLQVFLDEAIKALEVPSDELTPDQRIHIATIVSYVEALGMRFDRVRVPNFTQKRRSQAR